MSFNKLVGIALLTVSSCTTAASLSEYQEVARYKLPSQVAEASGLACVGDKLFVVNDSGNKAAIHQLNQQGKLVTSFPTLAANRDWEALTADDSHLFIADIGNNKGNIKELKVYQQELTRLHYARPAIYQEYRFKFADFDQFPIQPMRHDVDAEAMALHGNELIIFSKSWVSNRTRVYRLVMQSSHQALEPVASIEQLPGMVTGAHYDPQIQSYWVVGYNSKGLPKIKPFIARLSEDFQVLEVKPLAKLGQVEAICMDEQRNIWLAQEQLIFKPALLIKMQAK